MPKSYPACFPLLLLAGGVLTFQSAALAGVDSVVTFNEVHYNPTAAQTAGEWIELKNQNSTDVDLSGWRLDGGVDFVFPNGTVIGGGKYLVIAANPAALMAAHGITGVAGPLLNSLDNDGETVTLKNNNGRRMDEIAYNDKQPWPVAADGSGATLAKIDELHDSVTPENWRASVETGGTPGVYNFTEPNNGSGAAAANGVPGPLRRYYKLNGNASDTSGSGLNGTLVGAPQYMAEFPSIVGSGQSLDCNGASQYVDIPDANHPAAYTISAWVKPDTIRAQSIVVRTDASAPTSSWSHQIRMTSTGKFEHYTFDGGLKSVIGTTTAVAGQWYHVAIVAQNGGMARLYVNGTEEGAAVGVGSLWASGTRWMIGSNSGHSMNFFDGRIDEVAFWLGPMDSSQVGHIATGFKLPTDAVVSNLALGRAVIGGSGAYLNLPFNGGAGAAGSDFSALNVTDGSASDVFGNSYWLGREGFLNEHFILDLGNPVAITQLLLRNTHNTQYNDRGTADFRVYASSTVDGSNQLVNPAQILEGTLATRSSQAPIPADSFTSSNGLTPVTARYLMFEAQSSSYVSHVGLNEIEVFGTALPGGGGGGGRPPALPLVINELTDDDEPVWWMELYNHGSAPLDLTGYVLATNQGASYTLPSTTVPGGGFLQLNQTTTGLHPLDGDKVFLYGPGKTTVVDAVLQKAQKHQLRRPPVAGGAPGEFVAAEVPADKTPGTANQVTLPTAVVINEIMYHRRPQFQPYVESAEEWIELYNKSGTAVDLSGWELDGGIAFTIPAGTMLAAGAYLCVSNDAAAFTAAHPGVVVVGDISGGMSNRGDRVILRDAQGNAVDDVFYRDKEPWPIYTDGLGSSLELKNPHADNSVPESWAASDESTRSSWRNYTVTATAATPIYTPTITATGTTAFHELRMALLEEGEVLVDDVSVQQITPTAGPELIQNGTFSTALTPVWRVLGTHDASSIVSDAGNPVLQIRASGPMLYMHNLLETSLKSGGSLVPVVDGRQYTISLRAKWLRGCPWLHTEFYYNKVAKTFLLDLPAQSGTPGAQNSVYQANTGPTFTGVLHAPAVPNTNEAITVRARVIDPQGVSAVNLKYSVNAGLFATAGMTAGADGTYSATIQGQSLAGTLIQFYLEATDAAAQTASWPAAGVNARAMIKISEGGASATKQNLRVITTVADANELASQVNMMSNHRRGCTIIHNEREIFYDGKIRLRGSMYSRSNSGQAGESITFPSDHLFRGTQRTISARRSGMNEIIIKHAINRAGGLPDNYNDIMQLISFRSDIIGAARVEMERFSNSWLDEFYPEGSDGTQFKLEGIRVPTQTFDNTAAFPASNPEGIKNLTTTGMGWVVQLDLADLGPDGEQYRHAFRFLNNFSRNDNARFVQMCRALSMPVGTAPQQTAFEAAIEPLMDVDEWMRCFAMMSLFGVGDVYSQPPGTVGNISNPHNLNFYMPPTADGRVAAIPWDWNFVFSQASTAGLLSGDKNIQKVIQRPRFKRLFLGHFKDLIDASFNSTYMAPWLAHYGSLAGEGYTGYTTNITNRVNSVLSQINSLIPPVTFTITTNLGANFSTAGASTVLEGGGWVDVREIRLNGSPDSLPVKWLNENSWRITVPLGLGVNNVVLTAFNGRGVQVGTDSVVITNTSTVEQASAANIVISELHYHPAAGEEFIEVMNISPSNSVDLSGCSFTNGVDYVFPAGTVLNQGARLVVTEAQFLNATALSNGGEHVKLEAPGGVVIKDFTYDDEAPWPAAADGLGPSLVLIAPKTNPDHTLAANWRASTAAGGNAGTDDAVHFTGVAGDDDDSDGWTNLVEYALGADPQITHAMTPQGLTFTIPRVYNADDAEITGEVSTALTGWTAAELITATETSLTFRVPAALSGAGRVFLRASVRLR